MNECWLFRPGRDGAGQYRHEKYICSTYSREKKAANSPCGHHTVPARAVENWLATAMRTYLQGPAHDELIRCLKKRLVEQAKTQPAEVDRLQHRLADLETEAGRLVSRITCQWKSRATKAGRTRCELIGGTVFLRDSDVFSAVSCLSGNGTNAGM